MAQSHFFSDMGGRRCNGCRNVILLAQCLSNRARSVYTSAIGYLGQDRGQRSWSAKKCLIS